MKWISVEKDVPPFNIKVLAYDTARIYIAYRVEEKEYNEHRAICDDVNCCCVGCTGAIRYWMPLPKEPKE